MLRVEKREKANHKTYFSNSRKLKKINVLKKVGERGSERNVSHKAKGEEKARLLLSVAMI